MLDGLPNSETRLKLIYKLVGIYHLLKLRAANQLVIGRDSVIRYHKISTKDHCKLTVGNSSIIEANVMFDRDHAHVSIGDRTFVGASTIVSAEEIEIGDDVLISWGCTIVDHNSHSVSWASRKDDVLAWHQGLKDWSNVKIKSVKICNKAWIGFNAIILKGVKIGEGAVVGAGSVVTKDVPPYTIVAGNPARVIRELSVDER